MPLLSEVIDNQIILFTAGIITQTVWLQLPERFPTIELDEFILMPNHLHAIVHIVGAGLALPDTLQKPEASPGAASSAPTLGDIVRAFKSISAIEINRSLSRSGVSVWQRNYYEHVVRNDEDLNAIRSYIQNNPFAWSDDDLHPDRWK